MKTNPLFKRISALILSLLLSKFYLCVGSLFGIKSSHTVCLLSHNCSSFGFGWNPGPIDSVGVELMMTSVGPRFDVFVIYTVFDQPCWKETCSESNARLGQFYINKITACKTLSERERSPATYLSFRNPHQTFPAGVNTGHIQVQLCNILCAELH